MSARLNPLSLLYHGVADVPLRQDIHGLFVRPKALRAHVEQLRRWGYELVTFSELAARVQAGEGEGSAALTFDDGPEDNLTTLAPILRELEAPATVFAVSGWLGLPYRYAPWARILTADQLRELAAQGIEIGAHTVDHSDLEEADFDTALRDWTECRSALESVIGKPVTVAAYPYGHASEAAREAAKAAGFVAVGHVAPCGSWDDPMQLPRQAMANDSTLVGLRLKRDNRYESMFSHLAPRVVRKVKRLAQRAIR